MKMNLILKSIIILMLVILELIMSSCTSIPKGWSMDDNSQVVGIDFKIPIPLVQNISIVELKLGYINNNYHLGRGVKVETKSNHKNISLIKTSGTVERSLLIEPIDFKTKEDKK